MLDKYYVWIPLCAIEIYVSIGVHHILSVVNHIFYCTCRSVGNVRGRINMDTFNKQTITPTPITLAKAAMLSYMREKELTVDDFMNKCDPCGLLAWCTRSVWPTPELFLENFRVYGSSAFQLRLVLQHDLDDDINCSEDQNTYDALRMSEFNKVWFKFVHKFVYYYYTNTWASPVIEITPHWYSYLVDNNIILELMRCRNVHHIMEKLLILSGDVETNPGPSYKDLCNKSWKRSKRAKRIEQLKQEQHILRQIRKQEEEYIEPRERIIAEMQIFSAAASVLPVLGNSYLGYKTDQVLKKVNFSADLLTNEITTTLQQFRQTFSKFEQFIFKGFNLIDLVADIIFSLLQVSFARVGCKIASLSMELFRLLSKHCISTNLIDGLRNLIAPYFNVEKKEVSMQIDEETNIFNMVTEISPTHIVVFLFGILSLVFTQMLPKTTEIEKTLERIGKLGRSSKGIKDFNEIAHSIVGTVLEDFKVNVLGLAPREKIEEFVSGIDRWFDETRALLQRTDEFKKSDEILKDPAVIIEVENLYMRGLEFSKEISEKKLHRELQLPFQMHMRLLTDLNKMVDTSGAFGTRPRTQPVVVWLFGDSGVGKSGMSWPLAIDLNNLFVQNPEEAMEFSKNIYMRNVEQEFWDNYQRQNIVIYDDFGQRKDSTGNPNEEFMELIRMANIAPYPLHMAHLEDKRKTRFTSKVLLLTSNKFDQVVNSLTFPDAFRRRIDLCGRVTNVEGFTKAGYSASEGKAVQRLDKAKVREETGDIISTSVYEIDLIDPESGAVIETGLNYEEFLERAVEKTRDAFDSSTELNAFLEKYAKARFESGKIRKNVQMQIDVPEDTHMFTYGMLDKYTEQEILDLNETLNIADKNGKRVDIQQVRDDLMDEYYMYDEQPVECHEWIWTNIRKNYVLRETKIYRKLMNAKKSAIKSLNSWKEEAIKYTVEHPFIVASTVLGTLSALFMVSKFWTRIFGKPRAPLKVKESLQVNNVKILKYSQEEGVNDLRTMREHDILRFLPIILSYNAQPLLMKKPYPSVMAYLESLRKPVEVYVSDDIIHHHGNAIKLEAQVSGDAITLNKPKITIEALTSGDCVTQKPPKPVIEASASGDTTTLKVPRLRIEANTSGDNVTLKVEKPKVEADMQMWKDQVAQNLITNRIFTNLYKISRKEGEDIKPLLHGLFVRANLMLVPGHLLGFLEEEDTIELRNAFEVKFELPWKSIGKIPIVNALGQQKEAALLIMPKYVSAHSDIVKHFSDSDSMAMYRRADTCIPVLRYFGKMQKFLMSILGNQECRALERTVILDDKAKGEYILRAGLEYKCPTTNGDCGAPLIINETQVLRKIAGIHVAGASDGMAYAESITQKDLQRAFAKIAVDLQIQVDFDQFCALAVSEVLPLNEIFSVDQLNLPGFPGKKFNPVGVVAPIHEPAKTELRPSLVYGKISEIKTKPAILRSKEVNMKHKNLEKCAMDTPYISEDLIERSYKLVKNKWLNNRDTRLARILTWEESIMGSSDSEYLGPIKRQSSPGYPWILKKKGGMKGKTGWFGNDEYVLSEEVKRVVEHRIEQARMGIRVPTVWVDTLKDERRPIAKVDALKTRVFSNGPMDFTIAFRQYFLGFVAHLMENRITNEVCIGTNVYSQDWKKLADHLQKCGTKVVAGDFQNFDGTLNVLIMEKFADMANEFYNDGEENATIRKVLMIDVINSVHLCDGFVYMMTHSQPSGNPITTPLNCLVNSMGIRICFEIIADIIRNNKQDSIQAIKILDYVRKNIDNFEVFQREFKYDMRDAEKHLSIASYGDDDVINFTDVVAPWFNMTTLTHAFELIGMTYTDEAKTQGTAPDWKTLKEVSFLKRQFRYDVEKHVWEAPLSMDTILEMPNWCRGGLDIHEGTKVNCENAIMELSMHERPVYDKWTRVISNAFYEVTGDQLEVDTYRGYFQKRYMEYYAI